MVDEESIISQTTPASRTIGGDVVISVVALMSNCSRSGSIVLAIVMAVLVWWHALSGDGFCESSIQGPVVNAPARVDNATNLAAGSENTAGQASVVMKTVKIGGAVTNSTQSTGVVNAAVGKRNLANQGSISVSRGTIDGAVINNAAVKSTTNLAVGAENKADQASVRMEGGKVRGAVMNEVNLQKSANLAIGTGNRASQGAVVMERVQVRGAVVNSASVDRGANIAMGQRNEASQSSIVIDGGGAAAPISSGTLSVAPSANAPGQYSALAYPSKNEVLENKKTKGAKYVPGQVAFLVANDSSGLAAIDRVTKKYRLELDEKNTLASIDRIMVVASTRRDAGEIAEALKQEAGIHNPQPNYIFTTMGEEDPLRSMQNLVSMLDLPKVHEQATGKSITVAVVDTGVEVDHEDLRTRMVGHHNFVSGSAYRGEIHGTAVAGIIGAEKNHNGIIGIAPQVSLLALRACRQLGKTSAAGECFSTSLVKSIDTAISAKVQVVNLSLGAYVNDNLLGMMIDSGHGKGIVFAAPVGNDPNAESIAFPASHDRVISVAGLDEQGNPLPNKKLASIADAVAPATHLFVTTPGNGYNFIDGTSLASATISGIVALSLERREHLPPCLPRFVGEGPWARQVRACLGL